MLCYCSFGWLLSRRFAACTGPVRAPLQHASTRWRRVCWEAYRRAKALRGPDATNARQSTKFNPTLLASVLQLVILAHTTGSLPRRHLRHKCASCAGVGGAAAWVPRKGRAAVRAPRADGGRLFSPGRCDGGAVRHCPISTQPPYVAARRRCSALLRYDVRPEPTND